MSRSTPLRSDRKSRARRSRRCSQSCGGARIESLYRGSAPWPRLFEAGPALGLALLVFWRTRAFAAVWPCYAYIGYLLLDLLLVPQRRLTKWIRNGSAAGFVLVYGAWALPRLGLPALIGARALLAL